MPYQDKQKTQNPGQRSLVRPEEQFVPEQHSFGMPNSVRMSIPVSPPGTPNSVMREMEAEDRGALFRGRGFDSSLGVHELSHTVRRASVLGPVRQTVPSGTIQRDPDPNKDDEDDDWENLKTNPIKAHWWEVLKAGKAQKKHNKLYEERQGIQDKIDALVAEEEEKRKKAQRIEAEKNAKIAEKMFTAKSDDEKRNYDMGSAMDAHLRSSQFRGEEDEEPGLGTRFVNGLKSFFRLAPRN